LSGLSEEFGKRARTNLEQLISITRPYGEWQRDPERLHVTPGSVAITSGVWPKTQRASSQFANGVGSDVMAFSLTYHQHGAQKHPVEGWLEGSDREAVACADYVMA
jgi:cholesterol oxidase